MPRLFRACVIAASLLFAAALAPARLAAQTTDTTARVVDSMPNPFYWRHFAEGFAVSLAAHEAGHILMSIALGAHPSFGFNDGRPTIYSGISAQTDPHKQFLFSSAGLNVQTVIDEAILDIPHSRGNAFERGVLGGGIGTTLFYLTIGRTGSVSDIEFMARTHGMTKTQATFLYGGIITLQSWRISRDKHYANFFARPRAGGGGDVGMNIQF